MEKTDILSLIKSLSVDWAWWFTPELLAIQKTEIRRIKIQSQPGQKS
jgi:hypothetical protein